ncbi:hypothetical protein M3Y95_00030300 [Aphelenchoides besseyi]|nr:hypothetical protein M3Y95_00030300 [Aphelenchoides besseyi]
MRRLRILLLLCTLAALLTISNGQKSVDDETIEGSANVDNPDDEEFDGDQSGLPDDDEKTGSNPGAPTINVQPTTGQPVLKPTTVIIQPGSVDSWSLDTTTLIILLGALFVVILIIVIAVVCVRKRTNKEYTRGNRAPNAYV